MMDIDSLPSHQCGVDAPDLLYIEEPLVINVVDHHADFVDMSIEHEAGAAARIQHGYSVSVSVGFYVIGMPGIIGSLVGRMPCAWVCPFGFFQELMYKIPSPKFKIPGLLSYLKYVFLGLFVLLLPLLVVDEFGFGQVWFCKYVCPAGTLEAGIPLLVVKSGLRGMIGTLFYGKMTILAVFLVWMVVSRRPSSGFGRTQPVRPSLNRISTDTRLHKEPFRRQSNAAVT